MHDPDAVRREDGCWLVAGSMPVDEMADQLGMPLPPNARLRDGGGPGASASCSICPTTGEATVYLGWRFEVVDMDGRRIDKILASRIPH